VTALLECIPNVSEGRDASVLARLAETVERAGARLVDMHSDVDHHRSVFTFLGEPHAVERAALALGCAAVDLIDLRRHAGVHPRIGSLDVMPFVPLTGVSMAEAVAAAHRVGRALAAARALPVFFYEAAASGTTVLVTTHYMDEAEYCDRISIMVAGRIDAMGTPAELKQEFGVGSIDELFVRLARPSAQ